MDAAAPSPHQTPGSVRVRLFSTSPKGKPLKLPAERVLEALSGRMTAAQIAERLGYPKTPIGAATCRSVVPVLEELHGEGLVGREVTTDDKGRRPTVRWRRA